MSDSQNEQQPSTEGEPRLRVDVLAAEDHDTLRRVNELFFLQFVGPDKPLDSYESVANGNLAVEKIKAGHYSALLLDNFMPGVSGAEVARIARARNPKIVIVLFSSHTLESLPPEDAANFDLAIPKPATREEISNLASRVRELVTLKQSA